MDDPLFLVMLSMKTLETSVVEIPRTLERREAVLVRLAGVLEEQSDDLKQTANDIVMTSQKLNSDLERMLKIKVPHASRGVEPGLKKLLLVGMIGILFGSIFGHPLFGFAKEVVCHLNSHLCIATTKKVSQ